LGAHDRRARRHARPDGLGVLRGAGVLPLCAVLVGLSDEGASAGLFAGKPAPMEVCAVPVGTGLPAMSFSGRGPAPATRLKPGIQTAMRTDDRALPSHRSSAADFPAALR